MEVKRTERKGGDIFASDMELQERTSSKIADGFENSTVFLTGATGYLGKMFLEKLLRLSKTVKVFILVRPKKGKDTRTRFQEIFEGPVGLFGRANRFHLFFSDVHYDNPQVLSFFY